MPEDHLQHQKATYEDWERLAEATLKGAPLSSLDRLTEDGISIKALYTSLDCPPKTMPGIVVPREWLIAQRLEPQTTAAALNSTMLEELTGGTQRLQFPADMDISILPDALRDVLVGAVSFGVEPGQNTAEAAAAILKAYTGAGVDPAEAAGCLGADPWAMMALGIYDRQAAEDALDATFSWMAGDGAAWPQIRPFAIAGDCYHELGLTAAGELAAVLAGVVALLRKAEDNGMRLEDVFSRMEFRLAAEADIYLSLAKTRALRHGLQEIADACGITDTAIGQRLHGITSARQLTRLDTDTNILRNGTAMLGLVLGGAGIITCLPHDWLTGSSANTRRLARNSHHLMHNEARLGQVADPAEGAYFLDQLTLSLGRKAWEMLQQIEMAGGAAENHAGGLVQDWAEAANARRMEAVNSGKTPLLGVTLHAVAGGQLKSVLQTSLGPRGGVCRPSRPWEELRQQIEGANLRVLLLDIGAATGARSVARWFQAIGITAAAMKAEPSETLELIATAGPDLVVTDGADAALQGQIRAMPSSPAQLEAGAFAGDVFALLSSVLGGRA